MTDGRPVVAIERCGSYEQAEVEAALERALAPLGGMGAFVSQDQTVFVKVNLLMKAEPDRAVTTHPALVRAVVEEAVLLGYRRVVLVTSTEFEGATALYESEGFVEIEQYRPMAARFGVALARELQPRA